MNRITTIVLLVAATLSVALTLKLHARAPDEADTCTEGAVSRIYFGQSTPWGDVTEAEWRVFVGKTLVPRFSSGFTELRGRGHWSDTPGSTVEEETRVIEVAHDGSPQARARVEGVAADYRRQFAQQSVLVTQSQALQCF